MNQLRNANVTRRFAPATNTEAPAIITPIIHRIFFMSVRRLSISDATFVRKLALSVFNIRARICYFGSSASDLGSNIRYYGSNVSYVRLGGNMGIGSLQNA